jgi:sigma-B regulation protein RsbU (phosphoserine phosphatase)
MKDTRTHFDLGSAREIQSRFFPSYLPHVDGLAYHGECRPVGNVGGDFFDFVPLPENRLAVSVGDVSGHGIGAAIMMSGLQLFLRDLTALGRDEIGGMVRELNRAVYQTSSDNVYATLFYAHADPLRRQLHYVSAGHEPALLIRTCTARVHRLESTGTVLGLTDRTAYGRRTLQIDPGDLLVAFTDGITESLDSKGRELREIGVLEIAQKYSDARPADLVARILDASARHAAPSGDRTVVVVRVTTGVDKPVYEEAETELSLVAA